MRTAAGTPILFFKWADLQDIPEILCLEVVS